MKKLLYCFSSLLMCCFLFVGALNAQTCNDPNAHNTGEVGACETCFDNVQNGDETGVDCGGSNPSCAECPTVFHLDVEGNAKVRGVFDLTATNDETSVFIGQNAGKNDDGTTNSNVFIGTDVGTLNTSGNDNVFVGAYCGDANMSGTNNTFIGRSSGGSNTSGEGNTFIGRYAGFINTTGISNTFLGRNAGFSNSFASNNTFLGAYSGDANTSGTENTFVGTSSGGANTTGTDNSFLGRLAGINNTTGNDNTFIGKSAGSATTTGDDNTFVGIFAGNTHVGGHSNICLGKDSDVSSANLNNATAIGRNAIVNSTLKMRFGSNSTSVIEGNVNYSTPSDQRFKTSIEEDIPGLEFINQLRPVSYQFDAMKFAQFMHQNDKGFVFDTDYTQQLQEFSSIKFSGFLAQEVEHVVNDINYDFSGLITPSNDNDNYGLRYAEFVVPLVKATQEQQKIIEDLKQEKDQEIADLKSQINQIQKMFEALLENKISANTPQNSGIQKGNLEQEYLLFQNRPNPFTNQTTIQYNIPKTTKSATIHITDLSGKILQSYPINEIGAGSITVQGNTFAAGIYMYSLDLDGELVTTKKMILTK